MSKSKTEKITDEELEIRENFKTFYQEHFDLKQLLGLFKDRQFSTREFGFIRRDDNRMYRNKSFEKPEHLVEYLSFFPVNHTYLGAIYVDKVMPTINYVPGTSIDQTEWVGRELTFDLDLTDYDPVRINLCGCQGRDFCEVCWELMQIAADIITETLEVDFGFKEIVWLFSGGRGYHCWVLDDLAFTLDETQRKAIVGYFQLIYTTVNYEKIEEIGKYANELKSRVYQKLTRRYILNTDTEKLEEINHFGKKTVEKAKSVLQTHAEVSKVLEVIPKQAHDELQEVVIRNLYPRLDGAVTEGHNHLIRLPGGVHAGTGYITQIVPNPVQFNPLKDATHFYEKLGLDPQTYRG